MNGNLWVILFIATILLFGFILGWMAVIEVRAIYTLGVRVENSLIASGWAGFSQIDLIKMSERLAVDDLENREIYLNKSAARSLVEEYIKVNLKLGDDLRANLDSYIHHRDQPVVIEAITVYNPDDLPAVTTDGIQLNRSTIHIIVLIPEDIKFFGTAYLRKSVPVDIESFLGNNQI